MVEILEDMAAHNNSLFIQPRRKATFVNPHPRHGRKITVQRAGGHYRARYAGMANNTIGSTEGEAKSRLKMFADGPSIKFDMKEKF
jgi:hypothetical protein